MKMIIEKLLCKIFKIQILWLSGGIIYARDGRYYPKVHKAVFRLFSPTFNSYVIRRLQKGESKYFEFIGQIIAENFKRGIEQGLKEGEKKC